MQPYYTIDFSAAACHFIICVNDIPIMEQEFAGQAGTSIPINQAILASGQQEVSIKVLPLSGQEVLSNNEEFSFKIYLFDVSSGFVFKEEIPGTQDIKADVKSKSGPTEIRFKDSFRATVPYRIKGWKNGEDLADLDEKNVMTKLRTTYNRISDIINKGDYESFKRIIKEREEIMATTMYLSSSEKSARIDGLIKDFSSGFKVMPFPEDAVFNIYGNGKTAVYKKRNGESALCLYNEEVDEELMLDLMFYIPKGEDNFVVI